jgi:glycerol-3-phosphate O-acyltransferase
LRSVVVRRVKETWRSSAIRFVRQHRIQLESASFIDRVWVREALAQDPSIEQAIADLAQQGRDSVRELRQRADAYAEEIAPFFSISAYYRFGASMGRRFLEFLFELVVEPGGFERQLERVPEGAVRVYVMNHRANIDPLVIAYGLLRHVPMSYAVGEWALVWPLHTLFRAFGSYFVRRGEKDPLYHAVLRRFVQLIAGHGAVTGFFIEGGLSRDGKLRHARTGLLDYLIGLRHDHPDREIVFMPVGLNYDRVFEDRILTREANGPLPKPTATERMVNGLAVLFWLPQLIVANLLRVATRSHRKFGYVAVAFGEPLRLSDWPGGSTLHLLPDEARKEALAGLGNELLVRRIGAVIPATPVPVFCEAMRRDGDDDRGSLAVRVREVLAELRAANAPLQWGLALQSFQQQRAAHTDAPNIHEAFDTELLDQEEAEVVLELATSSLLRRRVLRRVVTPTGKGFEPVDGAEVLVDYYANSLAHHLEGHLDESAS